MLMKARESIYGKTFESSFEAAKISFLSSFFATRKRYLFMSYIFSYFTSQRKTMAGEFTFSMGLRGFHVYRRNWKPYVGQKIKFVLEKGNVHDDFAVAGNAKLPGKLIAEVVGHVPLELS